MPLTREELEAQLKKLDEEEKGGKGNGPAINITVDLSDPTAVKRAKKLGYLPADFEDEEEPPEDEEPEGEEPPKRGRRASLRGGYGDE